MIQLFDLKIDGDKNITEHFRVKEFFNAKWTNEGYIDIDGVKKLEEARKIIGKAIHITENGGYRTIEQNKNQGGADNSYHLKGMAFDTFVDGIDNIKWALILSSVGFKGIGIYSWGVHADNREVLTIFKTDGR